MRSFGSCHEREYHALRNAAGLMDVTPLFKYDIRGKDAAAFLSRLTVRNVSRLRVGRVSYLCWCDPQGHIIDDGTCARFGEEFFRLTSAAPAYHWLIQNRGGFSVDIIDTSHTLCALSIQGPASREILRQVVDADVDSLRFFSCTRSRLAGKPGWLMRTGYTGDLGYELWTVNRHAEPLWDALMSAGKAYAMRPMGIDALDMARIEAGFVMQDVEYTSALTAFNEAELSHPFELGLGWTVKLDRDPFVGQEALRRHKARKDGVRFVGLVLDWDAIEAQFESRGLPTNLPSAAWRDVVPLWHGTRQVGRATSGVWSPLLKKYLALGFVDHELASPGSVVDVDMMVQWNRERIPATVTALPFFNPVRKKASRAKTE